MKFLVNKASYCEDAGLHFWDQATLNGLGQRYNVLNKHGIQSSKGSNNILLLFVKPYTENPVAQRAWGIDSFDHRSTGDTAGMIIAL